MGITLLLLDVVRLFMAFISLLFPLMLLQTHRLLLHITLHDDFPSIAIYPKASESSGSHGLFGFVTRFSAKHNLVSPVNVWTTNTIFNSISKVLQRSRHKFIARASGSSEKWESVDFSVGRFQRGAIVMCP
jgi:hypothetical protein